MKKGISPVIVILLFLSMSQLPAGVLSLDRDKSLSLALINNSDLLDAALSLETVKRNEKNTWNIFLPKIEATMRLTDSASTVNEIFSNKINMSPGLSISYTFSPGLKESIQQIKLDLKSSEISYEEVRQQLLMNVESEFYYLLTSRNNLEIQENNIGLARKRLNQIEIKYKNGLVSELDVLQEKVNSANLVPVYSSLESAYQNRLKEFLVVLGIDPLTNVDLTGTLEIESRELNAAELINKYLYNRGDIRFQMNKIEILNNTYKKAELQGKYPSVTLSASWAENIQEPFSSTTWENYSINSTASVSIGVNLGLDNYIPGSGTDLGIKAIADSVSSAKIILEKLVQNASLEIINLIDSLNTDKENLELSRLNLELSETSYQMTEQSFSKGKSGRMTLDDAQQSLLTARQNLLESQYKYMNNLITLRSALGLKSLEELK